MNPRGGRAVAGLIAALAVLAVFLGARIALLLARDPFFDELFTLWMARHPLPVALAMLRFDSGPPLYYVLARFDSLNALRVLSLLFATVQLLLVLSARRLGDMRWMAGLLLAVYPPAVLFAVDARAYALCALLVTLGVLLLDARHPFGAALVFVLAAHSHYYGALFIPLLAVWPFMGEAPESPAPGRMRGRAPTALLSFLLAVALFAPGLVLALQQPAQATRWLHESPFAPLINFSFAGLYPQALLAPPPIAFVVAAMALGVLALMNRSRFAAALLVPLAGLIALQAAGRPAYFPMRFESVVAGPLVLWMASSLASWRGRWGRVVAGALIVIGAVVLSRGVADHLKRPIDDYRQAAAVLRRIARPEDTVVASGYLWLEAAVALKRDPLGFPPDQERHPGWRTTAAARPDQLPQERFLWIGERIAPELDVLRREGRSVRPLFVNQRVAILAVEPRRLLH